LTTTRQQARRQRQDVQRKTALALVLQTDVIAHEDAQTATTRTHHPLAKRISDAGWSAFLLILSATATDAGRSVVAVPPASTSPTCSGGGVLVAKGLCGRSCPDGGARLHRDHNAARNMQWAGQALWGGAAILAAEYREATGL
jgi:IS605 OrfB family transposase